MIKVKIYRNRNGEIYAFDALNHSQDIVCSAVSALTLNTINAIEKFTDTTFTCKFDDNGGFLRFSCDDIRKNKHIHDVNLLLNTLSLGLSGIKEQYSDSIIIIDKGGV